MTPTFGITLDLHLNVQSTSRGGRSRQIESGYRPVCLIEGPEGETQIGLCELVLDHPIAPGTSGNGRLAFDIAVAEEVRALVRVGSTFALMEGRNHVATAEVRGIHT
jgi:hypothetical protein